MSFEYDKSVDAAYITLRRGRVVATKRLDDSRLIDLGEDGQPVGVELLNVRECGVDTSDLPEQEAIERILARHKIKVYA